MLILLICTAALSQDDAEKFEKIYYTYRHILYNLAKGITENEQDAEDILQNAFIKIADNLHCIDAIESRKTMSFLMVITKNCALDFLRKKKCLTSIDEPDFTEPADNTIESLASKIDYGELCRCIKALPSPYSETLYFHYVYDYSLKETARILERPVATVKMQLIRGKKILLKSLSEVQYE